MIEGTPLCRWDGVKIAEARSSYYCSDKCKALGSKAAQKRAVERYRRKQKGLPVVEASSKIFNTFEFKGNHQDVPLYSEFLVCSLETNKRLNERSPVIDNTTVVGPTTEKINVPVPKLPKAPKLTDKDRCYMKFKLCRKCYTSKPLSEFWFLKKGLPTKHSSCKSCMKQINQAWIKSNRERRAKYFVAYRKTIEGSKAHRKANDRYAKNHPERVVAWRIATKLDKKPCEICKDSYTHKHLTDPNQPLSVRYLCPLHHKQVHIGITK